MVMKTKAKENRIILGNISWIAQYFKTAKSSSNATAELLRETLPLHKKN